MKHLDWVAAAVFIFAVASNAQADAVGSAVSSVTGATGALPTVTVPVIKSDSTTMSQPSVALSIVAEGGTCGGIGARAYTSTGAPVECINYAWAKPVRWYNGTVSAGTACQQIGSGSLAFDSSKTLYVCK